MGNRMRIIETIKAFFAKEPVHRHDYEMVFENADDPLKFTLRCKCGDEAHDMTDALMKMRRSWDVERMDRT